MEDIDVDSRTHVIVDGGYHGDGFPGDVDTREDHRGLRDSRQPGGQLLGRQVMKLQVDVVLLRSDASKQRRELYLSRIYFRRDEEHGQRAE